MNLYQNDRWKKVRRKKGTIYNEVLELRPLLLIMELAFIGLTGTYRSNMCDLD